MFCQQLAIKISDLLCRRSRRNSTVRTPASRHSHQPLQLFDEDESEDRVGPAYCQRVRESRTVTILTLASAMQVSSLASEIVDPRSASNRQRFWLRSVSISTILQIRDQVFSPAGLHLQPQHSGHGSSARRQVHKRWWRLCLRLTRQENA